MWPFPSLARLSLSLTARHARSLSASPRASTFQYHVCKMYKDINHSFARSISVTAAVSRRRNIDKVDDTFIDREYEKAKVQLEDPEDDDPRHIIQKMESDHDRRVRAIKRAKTARLFPQLKEKRTLTTDTMEQIRFLKQEQPDEWTIPRLANSFNVSNTVIIKVLKSKFVPSEKMKQKQDLQAKINLGLLPPGSTIKALENTEKVIGAPSTKLLGDGHPTSQNLLSSGQASDNSKIVMDARQESNQIRKQRVVARNSQSIDNVQIQELNKTLVHGKQQSVIKSSEKPEQNWEKKMHSTKTRKHHKQRPNKDDDAVADEFGNYAEDFDIEENDDNPPEYEDTEPLKVVQKGREFYDENGELLYRV
ncbi:neugrin-like [Amphiura filiformis]|uniref:neugrin-like n=1 Tax=Amphiura filiformis TaxID=82378 RepID=UPI003B20DC3C